MMGYENQRRAFMESIPQTPLFFATIAAVDPVKRRIKIVIEPWGVETGWCHVLKDTYHPIGPHVIDGTEYGHDPQWPYKVDQEVLAAAVRGAGESEQFVVLGLLDEG